MPAQKSSVSSLFGAVVGTIGFSALAGVLATVMVAPAIAMTGITANNTIGIFESLPDYIELNAGHQQNPIVATNPDGSIFPIATIFDQNREEVELNQMSDYLKWAAIAGEDRRFKDHGGVDIPSVIRAAVGQASGNDAGGASTLTMQTVRNILVQQALNQTNPDGSAVSDTKIKTDIQEALAPTFDRKLKEMKLAIGLEKRYSKDDILQAYLNIAGFGGNTYGVQAASLQYFSKNAADLTLAEAASLLAIVQYPTHARPADAKTTTRPTRTVATSSCTPCTPRATSPRPSAMRRSRSRSTPSSCNPTPTTSGCLGATPTFSFVCDYADRSISEVESLGGTPEERRAAFKRGGYTVVTSINPALQQTVTGIVQSAAPKEETRFELGAAVTSVQVNTGRILVMTQNKDYNNTLEGGGATATAVNFNADLAHGGSVGFQPGSTYKPYVLLAFLNSGGGLAEAFNASKLEMNQAVFKDSCGGPWGGKFKYKNDSGEQGSWTVMRATASSVNAIFVQMASKIDQCEIKRLAESIGVHNASGEAALVASVLLDRWLREQHRAGHCRRRVRGDRQPGRLLRADHHRQPHRPRRQHDRGSDGQLRTVRRLTGRREYRGLRDGGRVRGRYREQLEPETTAPPTWARPVRPTTRSTCGWSAPRPPVSTAVWVGNIKGKQSLRQISVNGTQAALLRHKIFRPTAQAIDAYYPGGAFPPPDPCAAQGQPGDRARPSRHDTGGGEGRGRTRRAQLRRRRCRSTPISRPVRWPHRLPGAGESVPRGTDIVVYTSNGLAEAIPDVIGPGRSASPGTI